MIQTWRLPTAQDTENYAEDAIVLADKFGQPTGDDVPAFISGDRSKRRFRSSRGHCGFLET